MNERRWTWEDERALLARLRPTARDRYVDRVVLRRRDFEGRPVTAAWRARYRAVMR